MRGPRLKPAKPEGIGIRLLLDLDRIAPARPPRPSFAQGHDPFKAHLLQGVRGEEAAVATSAIEDQGPAPILQPRVALGMFQVGADFEEAPRVEMCPGNVTGGELIRFAHIHEMPTVAPRRLQDRPRLLRTDLANLRARGGYEIREVRMFAGRRVRPAPGSGRPA